MLFWYRMFSIPTVNAPQNRKACGGHFFPKEHFLPPKNTTIPTTSSWWNSSAHHAGKHGTCPSVAKISSDHISPPALSLANARCVGPPAGKPRHTSEADLNHQCNIIQIANKMRFAISIVLCDATFLTTKRNTLQSWRTWRTFSNTSLFYDILNDVLWCVMMWQTKNCQFLPQSNDVWLAPIVRIVPLIFNVFVKKSFHDIIQRLDPHRTALRSALIRSSLCCVDYPS